MFIQNLFVKLSCKFCEFSAPFHNEMSNLPIMRRPEFINGICEIFKSLDFPCQDLDIKNSWNREKDLREGFKKKIKKILKM